MWVVGVLVSISILLVVLLDSNQFILFLEYYLFEILLGASCYGLTIVHNDSLLYYIINSVGSNI
jgi:hypothetical protein